MELMIDSALTCPYCGEAITIGVDSSQPDQQTIEDCPVCCRPINLRICCTPGEVQQISARRDDEA